MCQAISKGGRRCLRHAKMSQYLIRMIKFRTGADDATISAAMNELNREGGALPDATAAEAQHLVDQEAFAANSEGVLSAHERKIQLSQLAKAREEVKNGVKGSHLYVWKNLFKRVIHKLKLARKIAYVGAFLVPMALASCSTGVQPNGSDSPRPSISVSQSASPTPSQSASGQVEGDVVVSNNTVTDARGSYKTVTLAPNSDTLKFDQNEMTDPAEVKASGLSISQIKDAHSWVGNFVATQGMDSVALDNGQQGWDEWKSKYADKYLDAKYKDQILAFKDASNDRPLVILNDPNNAYAPLVRDGGPRVAKEKVSVDYMQAGKQGGQAYILANGTAVGQYRATDAGLVKSIKKLNPGVSDAQIKKEYPKLFNGKDGDVEVEYTLNFSYTIVPKGDSWAIAGLNNTVTTKNIGLK